jgi:peptide/nickel transport system permease protein
MLFGREERFEKIPIYDYEIIRDTLYVELYTGMMPNNGEFLYYNVYDITPKNCNDVNKYIKENIIETKRFFLGTDRFGRDVLSQLIIGARVSLAVGFISVFISLIIGILMGAVAGYFGGLTDRIIMWIINVVWSIPSLFLVIAITFALGKGFWQIFFAVGLTLWVEIARLVRGLVISIKEKEYIEAAKALGYSHSRIIVNHILPGTMGPIIVVSAANFASSILIESGLSFLGVGVQPPMPSWGTMLRDNYGFLIMDYAYLAIIPGLAIMLLVLTFMIIGNGIRDALDVKQTTNS